MVCLGVIHVMLTWMPVHPEADGDASEGSFPH